MWLAICVYVGLSGWWLTPLADKKDTDEFSAAAQALLHSEFVGNAALVIIENGQVILEDYQASVDQINRDTLFPLASMSKLFTAYGANALARGGDFKLDAPVDTYLTRWKLPENGFDNNKVTVKMLLSHTSGLTDGLGFGDYKADESLPMLEQSLSSPRASSGERTIAVGTEPGSTWAYSGGGYLLTELIVEEVAKQPFAEAMQNLVFKPLGLARANYDYLGGQENYARLYEPNGDQAPTYQYASKAATGLNASPADLTQFAKALVGQGGSDSDTIATMREPIGKSLGAAIWGSGAMLYTPTKKGSYVFGHDGANEPAINTSLRVNPDTNDAIIVLTTGSTSLASHIAYEWTLWQTGKPDFLNASKAIKSSVLPIIIGWILLIVVSVVKGKDKNCLVT